MTGVYEKYPDNLDVAAIHAEGLMNLNPWCTTCHVPLSELRGCLQSACVCTRENKCVWCAIALTCRKGPKGARLTGPQLCV